MFDKDYKSPQRQLNDRDKTLRELSINPKKRLPPIEKIPRLDTPEGMRSVPKTMEEMQQLCKDLIEWADKEDSLLLQQFALSKRISPYNFFKFATKRKNELFSQAFEYARAQCLIRMAKQNSELKDRVVDKYLPLYDSYYSDYLLAKEQRDHEYQKELKTIEDKKSSANIIVQMDPVISDIVPKCIDNKS